jgi:hypothetical protein
MRLPPQDANRTSSGKISAKNGGPPPEKAYSFEFFREHSNEGSIAADSRRHPNGSATMARTRCTGKALAERRRRAMRLHLAEFIQEEIAEKLGVHSSVVCRDLQSLRDTWRSADSPILRRRALLRRQSGNGDRHPTRCMRLSPGTLHPGAYQPFIAAIQYEEVAASRNERMIHDPLVDGYGPQLKL